MDLNTYTSEAAKTAIYPGRMGHLGLAYCTMALAGEAGEFCNQIKKAFRDDAAEITPARLTRLSEELGGILWYWSQLCIELNLVPEVVARENLRELQRRLQSGTIKGDHQ